MNTAGRRRLPRPAVAQASSQVPVGPRLRTGVSPIRLSQPQDSWMWPQTASRGRFSSIAREQRLAAEVVAAAVRVAVALGRRVEDEDGAPRGSRRASPWRRRRRGRSSSPTASPGCRRRARRTRPRRPSSLRRAGRWPTPRPPPPRAAPRRSRCCLGPEPSGPRSSPAPRSSPRDPRGPRRSRRRRSRRRRRPTSRPGSPPARGRDAGR